MKKEVSKITEKISITDADTASSSNISKQGYTAVLCLDAKAYLDRHPDTGINEYVLESLPPSRPSQMRFEQAVEKLLSLVKSDHVILVHCTHGVNRSVAVVAAALVDMRIASDIDEAISIVQENRGSGNQVDRSYEKALKSR
jgi:protein-tyrosine phosphatase